MKRMTINITDEMLAKLTEYFELEKQDVNLITDLFTAKLYEEFNLERPLTASEQKIQEKIEKLQKQLEDKKRGIETFYKSGSETEEATSENSNNNYNQQSEYVEQNYSNNQIY